ncbi:Serpin-Z2B [Hordeum vulgare]|nr:Serpin-Z2B [Hordeum vulgare]
MMVVALVAAAAVSADAPTRRVRPLAMPTNRLTNVASVELASALSLLQDVATNNAPDDRFLTHGSSFSSRCAYSLLSSDHEIDLNAGYIWSSKAPIKSSGKDVGACILLVRLLLEDVFHKAVVEVNEEGTEASAFMASTWTYMCESYPPPQIVDFIADHPFVFFIVEEVSRAVVFAGHVLDPSKTTD